MTKPDDAPQPAPAWQSADDIPAWVPLRLLRSAVALAIGETAADGVTRAIMRAVTTGAVASRYTTDFSQWRQRARERGEELQHAGAYGAAAGRMLAAPGTPLGSGWVLDQARGIVLAPGDPRGTKPVRDGVWPLGPVEVSWAYVEALPAFRDAQARAAATPKSAPTDAAEGSPASRIDKPAPLPWAHDPEPWQRAQLQLIAWCDEEGAWPLPGEHGGQARLVRYLLAAAEIEGKPMSERTAKRRVAAILATPQAERVAWPIVRLRPKNGPGPS
jgi:hypothetical protein